MTCQLIKLEFLVPTTISQYQEHDLPTNQIGDFSIYNNFTTSRTNPSVYSVKF